MKISFYISALFIFLFFNSCVRNPGDDSVNGSASEGGLVAYVEVGNGFHFSEYNKWTAFAVSNGGVSSLPDFNKSVQLNTLQYENGVARVYYTHPEADTVFRIYFDNKPFINQDRVLLCKRQELFRFRSADGYSNPYGIVPNTKLNPFIPADAFIVKSTGLAYTGWVKVLGSDGAENSNGRINDYINGINIGLDSNGVKKLLVPVAFANWTFLTENGEELVFKQGSSMRFILSNSNSFTGNYLKVYYLNKNTGMYKVGEQGESYVNGYTQVNAHLPGCFIFAFEFELAEIHGRITGNYNKPMPGVYFNYGLSNPGPNSSLGSQFVSAVDQNGYFYSYIPANLPITEHLTSTFVKSNWNSPGGYDRIAETVYPPFPTGKSAIPDRHFDRNFHFVKFKGGVVDSFLNPIIGGSVEARFLTAYPGGNHNIISGPLTYIQLNNGNFNGNVLVTDTILESIEFKYHQSDMTIPGTQSSVTSARQYQFFDLLSPVSQINANPVINYRFDFMTNKAIVYKGTQRYLSDVAIRSSVLGDTATIIAECDGLNGQWSYVVVNYIKNMQGPEMGDRRVTSLSFINDTLYTYPIEKWTPVGDTRIVINYGDTSNVLSLNPTLFGAMKGTFRSPGGETAEWKMIFNTGR